MYFAASIRVAVGAFVAAAFVSGCGKHGDAPRKDGAAPTESAKTATPTWPPLPATQAAARSLIGQRTTRKPVAQPALTPALIEASVSRAAEQDRLRAGWEAVRAELAGPMRTASSAGRASFVLFGSFHDSAAQVAAFRRLSGPLGVSPSDAVVEQFRADGNWENFAPDAQRGDTRALDRFQREGTRAALQGLLAAELDHNHTAWKYDYMEEMLALPSTLRASGVELHGCDMPSELQMRVRALGEDAALRLRELHCVLALDARAPAKITMLWGAHHIEPDGVERFLPKEASVSKVHIFGGRPETDGTKLKLAEPLLVPIEGANRFALFLAEGSSRAVTDRSRTELGASDAGRSGKLEVTSESEVSLWLAGKKVRVGPKTVTLSLSPGDHAFLAEPAAGPRIAGAVAMPEHGFVELALDPKRSGVRVVIHAP
jgi:hypothetical protein